MRKEVNDLNLEVTVEGDSYLGNNFSGQWSVTGGSADDDNNYEAVFLPAGTSGQIDVTITAFNIAGDATDQDFALVVCNASQGPVGTLDGTVYEAGGTPATDPVAGASVQATGLVPNPHRQHHHWRGWLLPDEAAYRHLHRDRRHLRLPDGRNQ